MALRIQFLYPDTLSQPLKSQSFPFSRATHFNNRFRTQIPCANKRISDADLASDLATEMANINTHLAQREDAIKKSKELLFSELCKYLAMENDELKRKWSKMDQDEKWVLVKKFVNEWGVNFHPLSARSVRDMIEEYLNEDKGSSNFTVLFPGLKRMMGFSQNK